MHSCRPFSLRAHLSRLRSVRNLPVSAERVYRVAVSHATATDLLTRPAAEWCGINVQQGVDESSGAGKCLAGRKGQGEERREEAGGASKLRQAKLWSSCDPVSSVGSPNLGSSHSKNDKAMLCEFSWNKNRIE